MILTNGSKILVAHRRLFENDHVRFFAGTVEAYDDGIARVTGFTFVRDGYRGDFNKKSEERTKLIPINSGTIMVYQLPSTAQMSLIDFVQEGTHLYLTDGMEFRMDLTEGNLVRQGSPGRR